MAYSWMYGFCVCVPCSNGGSTTQCLQDESGGCLQDENGNSIDDE
jgi:hypothetical protein